MLLRKAIVRLRGLLALFWYKAVYRSAFKWRGIPKTRKGFNLVIERGGHVFFGEGVFFNNYCSINCMDEVVIGDYCLFGEGVKIYDHNHRFRDAETPIALQGFKCGKVTIGKNSWIGSNAVILKGVSIGDNVIIGAGCVIDSDVPSRTIVKAHGEQSSQIW